MRDDWLPGERVRVTYEGVVVPTSRGFEITIEVDGGRLVPFVLGAAGKVERIDSDS